MLFPILIETIANHQSSQLSIIGTPQEVQSDGVGNLYIISNVIQDHLVYYVISRFSGVGECKELHRSKSYLSFSGVNSKNVPLISTSEKIKKHPEFMFTNYVSGGFTVQQGQFKGSLFENSIKIYKNSKQIYAIKSPYSYSFALSSDGKVATGRNIGDIVEYYVYDSSAVQSSFIRADYSPRSGYASPSPFSEVHFFPESSEKGTKLLTFSKFDKAWVKEENIKHLTGFEIGSYALCILDCSTRKLTPLVSLPDISQVNDNVSSVRNVAAVLSKSKVAVIWKGIVHIFSYR